MRSNGGLAPRFRAAAFLLLRPDGNALFRARSALRLKLFALLVDHQLRVTNDVDEQDVPDLELHF
jgi:hypothetical protein